MREKGEIVVIKTCTLGPSCHSTTVIQPHNSITHLVALLVEAHDGHEGCNLEDKVQEHSYSRVNGECVHGRHVGQGPDGEAAELGASAEQDRRAHLSHGLANIFLDVVLVLVGNAIVGVHEDEDVIHTNRQDEEGNHLRQKRVSIELWLN